MLKKIFTQSLNADFWTSVIMEVTGCPLPYLTSAEDENEKVNKPVAIGVVMARSDTEGVASGAQSDPPKSRLSANA